MEELKLFIKRSACFLAIIIAFLAICEVIARSVDTDYREKDLHLTTRGNEYSTIAVGSSHTFRGLRPDLVDDSVYNLGFDAQTLDLDLRLIRHYRSSMPALRRVLAAVSYHSFVDPPFDYNTPGSYPIEYASDMHLPEFDGNIYYQYQMLTPRDALQKVKLFLTGRDRVHIDSLGFNDYYSLSTRFFTWKNTKYQLAENNHRNKKIENLNRQYLDSLLSYCKNTGLECVLFTAPVHPDFYNAMDMTQYREMQQYITEATSKYGVRYINLIQMPELTDDDYFDATHLTDTGATKFSIRLGNILRSKE